ncbi:MAG: hypothetical protein AAF492_17230, partial [Verrucomicrobiota bacterium]
MARRAAQTAPDVSLFPFLSILACIIGALTLMITALSMSQLQSGRDPKDIARAGAFVEMQAKLDEEKLLVDQMKEQLASDLGLKKQLEQQRHEVAQLKKALADSTRTEAPPPEDADTLKENLSDLTAKLDDLKKTKADYDQRLHGLKQELQVRRAPEKGPTVMVKPSA